MSKRKNTTEYHKGKIGELVNFIAMKWNLDEAEMRAHLAINFPELKDRSVCANCTASMKAFWHALSPGLVGNLIKAIQFVISRNKNSFHLAKDLNLTKTEYNNFQKLRFHGLIAHVKDKRGHWLITTRGGQFLRGEMRVNARVKTFRNHVEEHSPETVHINDFKNSFPMFESEFAFEYQPQASFL